MSVSFGGFNENTATFKVTENIAKNTAVKMSESNTVAACAGGEAFIGFVTECDIRRCSFLLDQHAVLCVVILACQLCQDIQRDAGSGNGYFIRSDRIDDDRGDVVIVMSFVAALCGAADL